MTTSQVRFKAGHEEAFRMADLLEAAFDEEGFPVGREETPAYSEIWTVDAILFDTEPEEAARRVRDVLGADAFGVELEARALDEGTNWVAMSEEIRRPVVAGRFFLHGSHDRAKRPDDAVAIEIDAELAFGTGHHATTWACLAALDRVLEARAYERILDLGTGTAVLAIAVAKVISKPVLATDIDPVAVEIAQANCRLNGVGDLVACIAADGMDDRRITAAAPFDLVVANILARPLIEFAPAVAARLAAAPTVILSGLRRIEADDVIAAYRATGLAVADRIDRDDWTALVLERAA